MAQFRRATAFEIEHEGRLLSDLLEGSVKPYLAADNIDGLQLFIDRISEVREKNDIEINVILDRGPHAEIVASNVPDNVEEADPEEHEMLKEAFANLQPVVVVSMPVPDDDPDDMEDIDESHPDFHISPDHRIMEITTPLFDEEAQGVGAILVKTSLASVDRVLERSVRIILFASALEVLVIMIGLGLLMDYQLFRPLKRLAEGMHRVATGDLDHELRSSDPGNEIGVVAGTFNTIARQLAAARRQLHMYLNPQAIDEAHRRASSTDQSALAVERNLTVLFVDVVAFTTLAEKVGPQSTVALLNRFHDMVAAALVDQQGYVDKFVADEVIAIFDTSGHADRALTAGRRILADLAKMPEDERLQVRIGINTGDCILADIGSATQGRLDRIVIGD